MPVAAEQPSRTWPARWWWAAMLVIVVVAGLLRLTGYNFSLPYLDHPDEPNHNLAAQLVLEDGSAMAMGMHGYPPGIITLHYLVLRWLHDPAQPPALVIGTVRLLSIAASTGTLLIVALLGFRVAGPLPGLLAASAWAVAPVTVQYARYAVPDAHITFWASLALLCAIWATQQDRDRLGTWGVVALALAITFKYQAVALAPLVIGLPLLRLWTLPPGERRRIWQNLAVNLAVLAVFLAWLLLIYPTLQRQGQQATGWNSHVTAVTLPGPASLLANLGVIAADLAGGAGWLLALVGLGLLAWRRVRQHIWLPGLAALAVYALLIVGAVSVFKPHAPYRQLAGGVPALAVLLGIGLAAWVPVLALLLRRLAREATMRQTTLLTGGAVALVTALILLPKLQTTTADAYNRTLPDRRNDLAVYMDTSVPPGPYISQESNHKTFNPSWGGYTGIHGFPLVEVASVTARPLAAWRELGVEYVLVEEWEYLALQEADNNPLAEMLLLKTYPPDPAYRGPSVRVYRLDPMQQTAAGTLGPIHLLGYDLNQRTAAPGEAVTVRLYWQADTLPDAAYQVYNHLTPLDSRDILAQADGPPLFDTRRATDTWDDPAETLISREFALPLSPDLPPGEYRLLTGFYNAEDGTRLQTATGEDYLIVTRIIVVDEAE